MNFDRLTLTHPQLRSSATLSEGQESGVLHLKLEGEASLDSNAPLKLLLENAHAEAVELQVREVVVDLTQLEFLNSSGIKHFVVWVQRISNLPSARSYKLRFVSHPLIPWQRRSLESLRCFAPEVVLVATKTA